MRKRTVTEIAIICDECDTTATITASKSGTILVSPCDCLDKCRLMCVCSPEEKENA